MADDSKIRDAAKKAALGPITGWLRKGALLAALFLALAFVLFRMLPSVIKLFLVAIVIGAIVYFIKVGREDPTHKKSDE